MSTARTGLLSSRSTINHSRCCSLHGSTSSSVVPTCWPGLRRKAISAAPCAPRPSQSAAHAKASGTNAKGISHGSLADERPDLALQWVPESNGSQTPESVSAASNFTAAWRCGRGCEHCGTPHEWTAKVKDRSQCDTGCPLCSGHKPCRCRSVAAMHPELMKQWDWEGNEGTDPYSVGCSSKKKLSWICAEHGQWDAVLKSRLYNGTGCPECARQQRVGRSSQRGLLKDEMPGVYAELHPTKNRDLDIENLTCGSQKRVWWLCQSNHGRPEGCQHDHEWETKVSARCRQVKPSGCPFCTGQLICPCKSLAELQPALVQYWDGVSNAIPLAEPLDPSRLGVNSNRKVWWRHEGADGQVCRWIASIHTVTTHFRATGRVPCPICAPANRAATFAERRKKLIKRD